MRSTKNGQENNVTELLQDLLITSLGAAGVKQAEIRKIVGCDMNRVNRIVKHIPREPKRGKGHE